MKIKAKKSLGQNFLIDKNIIKKITDVTNILDNEILEVGPGSGNLTEQILKKKPKKIFVIEKDEDLCTILRNRFINQIEIINKDILEVNEKSYFKNKLIVFGNLPYNISTEIICNWIVNLKNETWFNELILMFQKEVADRIIAQSNTSTFGRLSVLSQWRLNVKKILDISPNSFSPKPKIYSSLLLFFQKKNTSKLIQLKILKNYRVFFNQRRKMIKNPLKKLFKDYYEVSDRLNMDLKQRPQNLSIETYLKITEEYEKLRS